MNSTGLWEWLDLGDRSRIHRFGEIENDGGFIIGGLKPSQAEKIVIAHNESIRASTSVPNTPESEEVHE